MGFFHIFFTDEIKLVILFGIGSTTNIGINVNHNMLNIDVTLLNLMMYFLSDGVSLP
jgi:hypothetical protein